jgi:GNAT superfamily N-acetyltransferase
MMVPYPLTPANRLRLARVFAGVPRVDIGIECAVEDQMGKPFAETLWEPQVFMIEQDEFFCYLAGDLTGAAGRDLLSQMPGNRFLMAGPAGWEAAVQDVLGERVRPVCRYRYSSEALSADHLRQLAAGNPHTASVRRVDAALASLETPYLSLGAFDSAEDFVERGIGFCLIQDGAIVAGAYSSLVCSGAIEVSIVVKPGHQRRGVATALAAQLLLWCLAHGVAPHWDAANEASCKLAEKLGYRKAGEYTAYYVR